MPSPQFERFKATMRELFMLDQADLDFGIYRIMNQKRRDVENYLDNRLPSQVNTLLEQNASDRVADLERQLREAVASAKALDIDPDGLPKVMELRKAIERQGSPDILESSVYSHLATFFSRYYDSGDFISLRRYKKDVYAIPYEGEEVKLHWANSDQYYIKTGEYFRTYSFRLDTGHSVEFTLKDATTEHNDNLAQNNMERRFAICRECPVEVIGDTLHINFTYALHPKTTRQKKLIEEAYSVVKGLVPKEFTGVLALRPSDKDRSRTLLQKHLGDYVAKNTFDYFIHKDLRGFLSRELDFYIKNEILVIDDINARSTEDFLSHLTLIKAIKAVGTSLIDFLAQLEEFQKRLWLKKKFVVRADWCITLDRVPRGLYADICANQPQREEWVRLFAIDEITGAGGRAAYSEPLTEAFLEQNRHLVLDTVFFSDDFRHRLLSSIHDLDACTDGLLVNSENFQALQLLQEKYRQSIRCVYIDPPYNAPSSEILYKNNYKDSSWLSLMHGRLSLSKSFSTADGSHVVAIDKYEDIVLCRMMEELFPDYDVVNVAIEHNKKGAQGDHFSFNNEFAVFAVPYSLKKLNRLERDEADWEWSNLRNWGGESLRTDAANCFYPILVKDGEVVGYGSVTPDDVHPDRNEVYSLPVYFDTDGTEVDRRDGDILTAIYPIDDSGVERKWRYACQSICEIIRKLRVKTRGGILDLEMPKSNDQFKTLWYNPKYNAGDNGTKILTAMGLSRYFSYPKSVHTTKDCIYSVSSDTDIILDYFAGSGTTGHAVINLNRADGRHGRRKYILVEMGGYFDTVTKPRIQKVIYSEDWSGGKPVSRKGSSHCFKYMRLEQYEDTLDNLSLEPCGIDTQGEFADGFLLGYMLDVETRGSLLNLKWFVNPFDVKLNITRHNETREENIDLPETFSYLIGLNVTHMSWPMPGIMVVKGTTRSGRRTLVIWRDCNRVGNADLNTFFTGRSDELLDGGIDTVYVNGDNNLANLRTGADTWDVMLTEEEFNRKMFG